MQETYGIINYAYVDEEFANAVNYYRLKNEDFDGTYEISAIDNNKQELDESKILLLYPNPSTQGLINLDAFIANEGEFRIEVYDLVGKKISSHKVYLDKGKQTIQFNFYGMGSGSFIAEKLETSTNERVKKKFVRTN
jgi:hypothetical protein